MQRSSEQGVDLTQLHPYQYLTQLNSIYNNCNKANAKSYSSVSKIKLTWKPFSIMKIPNCFQLTYESTHKNDKQAKLENGEVMDESERKIWKDHQEIISRYFKNKNKNKSKNKQNKRPQTSATYKSRNINACTYSDQASCMLVKKLADKGVKVSYDKQQVKEEVLRKLKNIQIQQPKKQVWRAQSAINCIRKQAESKTNEESIQIKGQLHFDEKPYIGKQRKNVQDNQYLNFNKNSDIIASYKQKIKQVDCAISEKNIRKTAKMLRNMESIVERLGDNR